MKNHKTHKEERQRQKRENQTMTTNNEKREKQELKMHGMQNSSGFSFSAFHIPFDRESFEDHEYHVPASQNPCLAELSSKYSKGVKSPKNSGFPKNDPNFLLFSFATWE